MDLRRLFAPFRPAWAAFLAVMGCAVIIVGYLVTAKGVADLGIPVPIWQGIGFLLFVFMIAVMLHHAHWHKSEASMEPVADHHVELSPDRDFKPSRKPIDYFGEISGDTSIIAQDPARGIDTRSCYVVARREDKTPPEPHLVFSWTIRNNAPYIISVVGLRERFRMDGIPLLHQPILTSKVQNLAYRQDATVRVEQWLTDEEFARLRALLSAGKQVTFGGGEVDVVTDWAGHGDNSFPLHMRYQYLAPKQVFAIMLEPPDPGDPEKEDPPRTNG